MSDPTPEPTPTPASDPTPTSTDPTPSSPDPKPDESLTVSKADWEKTQSALADMRRKAKKAEDDARKAADEKARQDGEFQKLAEQYQAERDQAQADLKKERNHAQVRAAAQRLKFRDPDDALALLPRDTDLEDASAVDMALAAVVEQKKYLVDDGTPGRTGGPAGSTPPPAGLDEQIAEAQAKGDWDALNSLNLQKLAALKPS